MKVDWIQCSDRLPKDEEEVLLYDGEKVSSARCSYSPSGVIYFQHYDREYSEDWYPRTDGNLYWMPFPEPPKD